MSFLIWHCYDFNSALMHVCKAQVVNGLLNASKQAREFEVFPKFPAHEARVEIGRYLSDRDGLAIIVEQCGEVAKIKPQQNSVHCPSARHDVEDRYLLLTARKIRGVCLRYASRQSDSGVGVRDHCYSLQTENHSLEQVPRASVESWPTPGRRWRGRMYADILLGQSCSVPRRRKCAASCARSKSCCRDSKLHCCARRRLEQQKKKTIRKDGRNGGRDRTHDLVLRRRLLANSAICPSAVQMCLSAAFECCVPGHSWWKVWSCSLNTALHHVSSHSA
jgi:hypothetical protein